MTMKALLISPPNENTIVSNNPSIIDTGRGLNPPLGLLYVAAYLEQHTHHNVEVLDCDVEGVAQKDLSDEIRRRSPDVVGIQALTFTLVDALLAAKAVKSVNSETPVVLGGPHVFIYPRETLGFPEVDYTVSGEGEIGFAELIEAIENDGDPRKIVGVSFKSNGEIVQNAPRPLIGNLDDMPFPGRHLTHYQKYYSVIAKRAPVTTMITSRGCPYRCSFCARPHLGKRFRARSAENVVDEMQECVNMGIRELLIYDDTFTIDPQRVNGICDEIVRRKLDIGWDIRSRIDAVNDEMLGKLKAAGCERIHYGVEAGSDEILKILRKGTTVDKVRDVFKRTKRHGITTLAYFMIGSPTESRAQILRSIELMKELDPDFAHITITTPFPATELYERALADGVFDHDFWTQFARRPDPQFVPELLSELSRNELNELIALAYRSFYTRPNYVLRRLGSLRSISDFARKAKAGVKVLRMK